LDNRESKIFLKKNNLVSTLLVCDKHKRLPDFLEFIFDQRSLTVRKNIMVLFVARCRICKIEFTIPDMGPCTDLEYKDYIKDTGFMCKCGKNDWQLILD